MDNFHLVHGRNVYIARMVVFEKRGGKLWL